MKDQEIYHAMEWKDVQKAATARGIKWRGKKRDELVAEIVSWNEDHPREFGELYLKEARRVKVVEESLEGDSTGAAQRSSEMRLAPDGKPLRKLTEPYMLIEFNYREDNEPDFVQLGLNGDCRVVPKDQKVLLPQRFLGVIRDAVEIKTVKTVDPATGEKREVSRQVPRFAYTVYETGIM